MDWLIGEMRQVLDSYPRHLLRLLAADRHARAGDDHRRARRCGGEGLRRRYRRAEPPRARDRGDACARSPARSDVFALQNDGMRYLTRKHRSPGRRPLRPQRQRDPGRLARLGRRHARSASCSKGRSARRWSSAAIRSSRRSPVDFARVPVVSADGKVVELSQLADIRAEDGPIQVIREEARRYRDRARQCHRPRSRRLRRRGEGRRRQGCAYAARAISSSGAGSSRTSSAPRRGSPSSCRWRSALIFLLLYLTFGSVAQAAAGLLQRAVRGDRRRHRPVALRRVPLRAGLGRLHRADRHRRAQRRRADLLHQQARRRGPAAFTTRCAKARAAACGRSLLTATIAALRPRALPVRHRSRRRNPAAARHRRDRRPRHRDGADADAAADPLRPLRLQARCCAARHDAGARPPRRRTPAGGSCVDDTLAAAAHVRSSPFCSSFSTPRARPARPTPRPRSRRFPPETKAKPRAKPPAKPFGLVLARHLDHGDRHRRAERRARRAAPRRVGALCARPIPSRPARPISAARGRTRVNGNVQGYREIGVRGRHADVAARRARRLSPINGHRRRRSSSTSVWRCAGSTSRRWCATPGGRRSAPPRTRRSRATGWRRRAISATT